MCRRREPGQRVAQALAALALVSAAARPARAADDAGQAGAPVQETVVRIPGGPPQPVSASVDGEAARRLAGTGGDPSLAAQDLPGVARPAPGASELGGWGAAPAETRVLVDAIGGPTLTHFRGVR